MKIYLAAPLFNPRELNWNQEICNRLEKEGFEVFLPQRDGGESAKLMLKATTLEEINKAREGIFEIDFAAVKNSDVCVFVTDGAVLDVGACSEVGMAKVLGTPVIALHQDSRSFIQGRMNLFVEGCITKTVSNLEELVISLKSIKE